MTETDKDEQRAFRLFANEIDAHYRKRFRYKSPCAYPHHPTVDINRAAVRLYLRFRVGAAWPAGSVVIAVIQFQNRRRGNGTDLLRKLVEMSTTYGYQNIKVEEVGRDASIQAFVRKFGFTNPSYEKDWIVPVERLRDLLAALPQRSKPAHLISKT